MHAPTMTTNQPYCSNHSYDLSSFSALEFLLTSVSLLETGQTIVHMKAITMAILRMAHSKFLFPSWQHILMMSCVMPWRRSRLGANAKISRRWKSSYNIVDFAQDCVCVLYYTAMVHVLNLLRALTTHLPTSFSGAHKPSCARDWSHPNLGGT